MSAIAASSRVRATPRMIRALLVSFGLPSRKFVSRAVT
jgi:hypothetical protein